MKRSRPEEDRNTDPSYFLADVKRRLNLHSDVALARVLDVTSPVISKIRNRHKPVGAPLLLRIHDVSGISIVELRRLLTCDADTAPAPSQSVRHKSKERTIAAS